MKVGGKKGRSGRPRNFNDEYHRVLREIARKYYYAHKDKRAESMRKYHKKNKHIMIYAKKHGLSIPEAREQLRRKREQSSEPK